MKIYKNRKKKVEILTVKEWFEHCPPTNQKKQWVDKRSAKEMAKFWTDNQKRDDFQLYLKKVSKELVFNYALPEISTEFDDYRSPRKTDLCIFAKNRNRKVLISIEGKADEHFGENYIDKEWILSINAKIKNKKSRKLDRIIELYKRFNSDSEFINLRYQLTYWLAGSIDEAIRNEIDTVFLIVQEFHSDITSKKKIDANKEDLDYFINFITNSSHKRINKNELIGPIKNLFTKQINLYIGKFQTYIE
ncbi:hypothetical protein H2O64_18020 [Kordia sp. YSTF-M3]|uniref:DUF6946 domain-containing protein n=1 Tax=Kordia aestuariivivens TaxID=2759037 RepID=A0ABR7QE28_9FLAO|nr:hypothetical protein [Kordia aestuariivivens]MBC8756574.1 hypothetical protein [Kordia aestuariivivens]